LSEVIVRGGTILTIDPQWNVVRGDLHVKGGRIAQVGGEAVPAAKDYEVLDAEGCVVLPGFVQSHIHTCQTLARGRADDLALLEWLKGVIWPYEASLTQKDVEAAARLAMCELIRSGTTAIQDMGTVRHTDTIFEVARAVGIRATIGKAMMDDGFGVPDGLREQTRASIDESVDLCRRWNGAEDGRLRYAFAPRFVLSCTEELLRDTAEQARALGARIHTHASENRDELAAVRKQRGDENIAYLDRVGLTGHDVGLAHCVWLDERARGILRDTKTHLLHCPSSNLKLASGIAEIPELMEGGVQVSLGADGAPCNNNLDAFVEMRLAALIHKPRMGPKAMPASQVVKMATFGGARALGLDGEIGSLEVGKRADVIVVDVSAAHVAPTEGHYSALVYACHATDVKHVVVDGRVLLRDKALLTLDAPRIAEDARARARKIFDKI
jgi:cytosine/adenosine deaminase-related metal-dependent hydrolase